MLTWIYTNPFTSVLLIGFLGFAGYAIWLRYRMSVSKARFALAVVATLSSCLIAFLAFMSGSAPSQILNAVLRTLRSITGLEIIPLGIDGPNTLSMILGLIITIAVTAFIFRFAVRAIDNWDGPVTVNVNELAKREQENSLSVLAFVEAQRLLLSKPDPVVSEAAVNWHQKQSEAPTKPPWHILARSIFEAAFNEVQFTDKGWRDRFQLWVGDIQLAGVDTPDTIVLLLVFDEEPDDAELGKRILPYLVDSHPAPDLRAFAVFNEGVNKRQRTATIGERTVEIWPRYALLRQGLRLAGYARDLLKRFERDVLGGTTATLRDTFVEAHVRRSASGERHRLSDVIDGWLEDPSRRQLAVTGEYGQGKSTAMLELCASWARRYLTSGADGERIPLLIELRGQNPAESDPIGFLSAWAGRYGLLPKALYNLIRAGDAFLIFEGFDELRNAGRAYDRHEHFNALWRMAYPGTKVIFTGRPNFFLDEREKNRTLRADDAKGAAGNAFTELWELDRLTDAEVANAVAGFGDSLGRSIMAAARAHPAFFEIVSRPSMLPVVATIWEAIENLQRQGYALTSAALLEHYIRATYIRKEVELQTDQQVHGAPPGASYLLLPREVREVLALAIVWRMADSDARNTISRSAFDGVIARIHEDVFKAFQASGIPVHISQGIRLFEERFKDETKADRLERICNEVASAALFVSDPAGGPSNLRLPHKQFYEYMIAKVGWTMLAHPRTITAALFRSIAATKSDLEKLLIEEQSLAFFGEIAGSDLSILKTRGLVVNMYLLSRGSLVLEGIQNVWKKRRFRRIYDPNNDRFDFLRSRMQDMQAKIFAAMLIITTAMALYSVAFGGAASGTLDGNLLWVGRLVHSMVFAAPIMMGLLMLMMVIQGGYFSSSPRATVLRKIVARRLSLLPGNSGSSMERIVLYHECFNALVKSPKSKILLVEDGDGPQSRAQKEFREAIAPFA